MGKNKLFLLVVMLVLGVFLSACDSIPGVSQNAIGGTNEAKSKGSSSSGVGLSFVDGNPPDDMFKGEDYAFSFVFENNIKQEINNMRIKAKGFDKGFVSGVPEELRVNRITKATTQGGPGIYSGLVLENVNVDGFTGDYSFNPTFDYCYDIRTDFREQLCVPSKRNECNINVEKSSETDGPVAVEVGKIQLVGDDVVIPLFIENKGNGEVVNECFNTEDFLRDYDFVEAKLGSDTGNCAVTSSEDFSLINKESTVVCRFPRSQDEEYSSQVTVQLGYTYQQSASLNLDVKDLDQVFN